MHKFKKLLVLLVVFAMALSITPLTSALRAEEPSTDTPAVVGEDKPATEEDTSNDTNVENAPAEERSSAGTTTNDSGTNKPATEDSVNEEDTMSEAAPAPAPANTEESDPVVGENEVVVTIKFVSNKAEFPVDEELERVNPKKVVRKVNVNYVPGYLNDGKVVTSKGVWTLKDWQPSWALKPTKDGDNTMTAVWEFVPYRLATVDYKYISESVGHTLPEDIAKTVPEATELKVESRVQPSEPSPKEHEVDGGKWVFDKYKDAELTVTEFGPNTVVGLWKFVPSAGDEPEIDPNAGAEENNRQYVGLRVYAFEDKGDGRAPEDYDPEQESFVFLYYKIKSADGKEIKFIPNAPTYLEAGNYYLENARCRDFAPIEKHEFTITPEQVQKGDVVEIRLLMKKQPADRHKPISMTYQVYVDGVLISDEDAAKIPWRVYDRLKTDGSQGPEVEDKYNLPIENKSGGTNYLYNVDGPDYEVVNPNDRWFYVEDYTMEGKMVAPKPIRLKRTENSAAPVPTPRITKADLPVLFVDEPGEVHQAYSNDRSGLAVGRYEGDIPEGMEQRTVYYDEIVRFYEYTSPRGVDAQLVGTPTTAGTYKLKLVLATPSGLGGTYERTLYVLDRRELKKLVATGDDVKQTTKYLRADEELRKKYDEALQEAEKLTNLPEDDRRRYTLRQGDIDQALKKLKQAEEALNGKTDAETYPPTFQAVTINEGENLEPNSFVTNLPELPTGTEIVFTEDATPDLTPGKHQVSITVKYPDGSKVEKLVDYEVVAKPTPAPTTTVTTSSPTTLTTTTTTSVPTSTQVAPVVSTVAKTTSLVQATNAQTVTSKQADKTQTSQQAIAKTGETRTQMGILLLLAVVGGLALMRRRKYN